MIDPQNITNYNLSKLQLEEMLVFWICVAGKNAKITAKALENFWQDIHQWAKISGRQPFKVLRMMSEEKIALKLKQCGIGCYKLKAKALYCISRKKLNLKTCTTRQLETVPGIGFKTARCFVMHSRENARCAGLDTHVLKFMADLGYKVPKSTPSTSKRYEAIEQQFLAICDRLGRIPAALDLTIWRIYSKHTSLIKKLIRAVIRSCN